MEITELLNLLFQNDLFKLLWSAAEGSFVITHLMVLLGLRNSPLEYLRKQQFYFLVDGLTHLLHILYYSINDVGFIAYINWRIMIFIHLYYWFNLIKNPPNTSADNLKQVFLWSSLDCKENRFDVYKFGLEILGTSMDILAHAMGFYHISKTLDLYNMLLCAGIISLSLYLSIFVIFKKDFSTNKNLMPRIIKKLI